MYLEIDPFLKKNITKLINGKLKTKRERADLYYYCSDKGSNYISENIRDILKENNLKREMLYFWEMIIPLILGRNILFFIPDCYDKSKTLNTLAYPPIPASVSLVYSFIFNNKETVKFLEGINFIDVGCGLGDKVFFMSIISDMKCHGIEMDYMSAHLASYLNDCSEHPIFCDNALNHDFSDYDRIYTYQPINPCTQEGCEDLYKLYKHIFDTMPINGMWLEMLFNYPLNKLIEENKDKIEKVSYNMFKKIGL